MCSSVYKLNIILSNHIIEIYIEQNALFSRIKETICIQNNLRVNICRYLVEYAKCIYLHSILNLYLNVICTHTYIHIVPVNL